MGMITAFNELLSCLVTGIFTALTIWVMAKFGLFPILLMVNEEEVEAEEDDVQ